MKLYIKSYLMFIICMLASIEGFAVRPISLVCISTFPPYAWEEDGVLKGIDVDIIDELFKRAGLQKTVSAVPAKRAIVYLLNGTVDGGFSGIKTSQRLKIALFADAPVHQSVYKLFVKKGNEFPFKSIKDLYGKRIGRNKTFVISPEFESAEEEGSIIVDDGAITIGQNLRKLKQGRFDALVGNVNEIRYAIKKLDLKDEFTELPHPVIDPVNVYLVFSRASNLKNKEEILSKLSGFLKRMEQDGTIDRIHRFYLE